MTRNRMLLITGALAYVVVFQFVYAHEIAPVWSYDGYVAGPRPLPIALLAFIGALLPALWLPMSVKRPSQVVYWLLHILVVVPVMIVSSYKYEGSFASIVAFWTSLLLSFFLIGQVHRLPLLRLRRLLLPPPVFWSAAIAFTIVSYAYLSTKFRLHLAVGSITDVYGTRSAFEEGTLASGALLAYVVNWNAFVLNPLYIGFGIVSKKTWMIAGGIVGQLLIFSFTGFKQVFFSALVIAAFIVALRHAGTRFGATVIWGMVGVVVAAVLVDHELHSLVFTNLFVRRLIAAPGVNTSDFFEFFSQNPKALLGNSILAPFVHYPYSLSLPNLIGLVYRGSSQTSANANLWADAFANFGYIGMVGFSIVLAGVMWIFDSLSVGRDIRLTSLLLGVPAIALTNAALFATLQSHGLLAALAVLYFVPDIRKPSVATSATRSALRGEVASGGPAMPRVARRPST